MRLELDLELDLDAELEDEFRKSALPSTVREAYDMGALAWALAVRRAIDAGIRNLDKLTNIVFFMHHPERMQGGVGKELKQSEPGYRKLADEWKAWRGLVKPMLAQAPGSPTPHAPKKAHSTWIIGTEEADRIRKHWGQALLDWASIPPEGREAKEFAPPPALHGDYKTVLAWKSADPSTTCLPNPRQRLQILLLLRDDKPYWQARVPGKRIAAEALRTAAAAAIRDYRELVVGKKICPKAAYNRLVASGKDAIYQMFIGMFQMLSPQGVPNRFPFHTESFANGIAELIRLIER